MAFKDFAAAATLAAGVGVFASPASAHPHVFVDARMEIVGDAAAELKSVRNVWRFDELFSSSVVVDFDKNGNGTLDPDEVEAVSDTVLQSIREWDFYTFVSTGSRDVRLNAPDRIRGLYDGGQLTLLFEMTPAEPVNLKREPVTFTVYDESYFVAFDFADAEHFQLLDLPKTCRKTYTQPDPDADASEWMNSVSMLKPGQEIPADGVDWTKLLATRIDVQCAS